MCLSICKAKDVVAEGCVNLSLTIRKSAATHRPPLRDEEQEHPLATSANVAAQDAQAVITDPVERNLA